MLSVRAVAANTWSLLIANLVMSLPADYGLMMPDYSKQPLLNSPSNQKVFVEQVMQSTRAAEKLLQPQKMQSRSQQTLQKHDEEQDGAAPQGSGSNAAQALQEAAQHSARQGQPIEGATASTGHSPDAKQQKEQASQKESMFGMLEGIMPRDEDIFTGQLLVHS